MHTSKQQVLVMHSLDSLHMALSTLQHWDAQLSSTAAGYSLRLYAGFYTISILASLWVYYVARRVSPGPWRALACLPVVALQLAATPLLVDRTRTAVLIVPVCGTLSLSAFKVIAYAMGRGPLAMSQCTWTQNLLQFGVVLALPVIPTDAFKLGAGASPADLGSQAPASWATFLKLYGAKAGGATVAASLAIWPELPELVRHWFYALCLSLTLGALWDFWCCVAVAVAGIKVAPSFDQPWLSTSFADYWSRRWNLTTSYLLRVMVYEPVREARFVPLAPPGSSWAPPASAERASKAGTEAAVATKAAAAAAAASTKAAATAAAASTKAAAAGTAAAAAAPAGPEDDDTADSYTQDSNGDVSTGKVHAGRPTLDITATCRGLPKSEKTVLAAPGSPKDESCSITSGSSGSVDSIDGVDCTLTALQATTLLDSPKGSEPLLQQQQQLQPQDPDVTTTDTTAVPAARSGKQRRNETPLQAAVRRVSATHATFFVSGLWHMLIFYYATGLVTYHWLAFFTLQGPIMVVEAVLKHYAKAAGFKLPYAVSVFLTNFLLIVVARPLFFGPCDWSGLCSSMMDNVKSSLV